MTHKKSLVYTRGGDKGMTSLVGGQRVCKHSARIEAYGTVDELNAVIGIVISFLKDEDKNFLLHVQHMLFSIGGNLATVADQSNMHEAVIVTQKEIDALEHQIDIVDEQLPRLKSFVLPSGARGASFCHQARTICRRAERRILLLAEEVEVDRLVLVYINRLSDYLFVQARKMNQNAGSSEVFWNNI